MKNQKSRSRWIAGFLAIFVSFYAQFYAQPGLAHQAATAKGAQEEHEDYADGLPHGSLELESHERLVTILQTNDIHGAVEPAVVRGRTVGGMAFFAGAVNAIRKGLRKKYYNRAGVLLVDAGDQFQGTLVSNFNEGQLLFKIMNLAGYDAVVPGNHDYDFGPVGWLDDRVNRNNPDKNPRGALERLVRIAKFPLIAANVYFRDTVDGDPGSKGRADFSRARRPEFARPYVIRSTAGVRVALIGMENNATARMTTGENVADLVFRDEVETYLEVRRELEGRADIYVLVMHNGDSNVSKHASRIAGEILEHRKAFGGESPVDLVVAGHTHWINDERVSGVPVMQAGRHGERFGRADFVWDTRAKRINREKSRFYSGVPLLHDHCIDRVADFCVVEKHRKTGAVRLRYEGQIVKPHGGVSRLIQAAREEVAPLADRKMGIADGVIRRHRIWESPLANAVTDAFKRMTGADIAMVNTGGLRADIPEGTVTYEDLFKVIPFSNHGVVVGPMSTEKLILLLERSIQSCGDYSALMQSGLRVLFYQECGGKKGFDPEAKLLRVETEKGDVIFERREGGIVKRKDHRVATLDFLASGGSGYVGFKGISLIEDFGIFREALANEFLRRPARFESRLDGRWRNIGTKGGSSQKND